MSIAIESESYFESFKYCLTITPQFEVYSVDAEVKQLSRIYSNFTTGPLRFFNSNTLTSDYIFNEIEKTMILEIILKVMLNSKLQWCDACGNDLENLR